MNNSDKLFLKKINLLKEAENLLNNNSILYYISGNAIINIYNNHSINNNSNFDLYVCAKDIKNIDTLNNNKRCIKKVLDKNGKVKDYKYIDKTTLYIDLNEADNNELGIYIRIHLNAKDYKEYKKINVGKVTTYIPKKINEYMLDNFGLGYKYLSIKKEKIPRSIIVDTDISYNEYLKSLDKNHVKHGKRLFARLKRKEKQFEKYESIKNIYTSLIKRTHSRYKLLELYEDKKDYIVNLYNKKEYKKLGEILKDYLYKIKTFYDLNLAVAFDKEVFDITIEYLKHDNQKPLANWLLKNVPEKHLKGIDFSYKSKGKSNKGQLKDLQNEFVLLMEKFDKLCQKNNIKYFFDSGTVLGAIRHKGFIPWDDDVDVAMTYDNYQKLLNVLKEEEIEGTKFVSIESNPNHTLYTAKIYNLNSTKVYESYSLLDSTYGFHLDILILDEYIDNKILNKLHLYMFIIYGQILNPDTNRYNINIVWLVKIINILIRIFGREKVLCIFRKIIFRNKNKKSKYYKYRWQKLLKFEKKCFEKQLYVPFENITIPIPLKYEEYLETQYGESWFIYPLEEDRMPSKREFNLYVPYKLYQDDYMSFINKEETNKAYRKLTLQKMRVSKLIKNANKEKDICNYYREKIIFNKSLNPKKINDLVNNNKYGEARKYLDKYYYYQLKFGYLNKNLLFIDDSKFLYNAVYILVMCGEYYNARKLLNCKSVKEILKNEYSSLIQIINNSKQIKKQTVETKIKLYKEHPYCIPFVMEYYPLIKNNKEKNELINNLMNTYINYGEIEYLKGLLLIESKDKTKGKEIIKEAKGHTRNGLIIQEMEQVLKE